MTSVSMGGGCPAFQYATSQLRPASDRMQQLFGKLDTDGNGAIDKSELKSFVDAVAEKSDTTAVDADALLTSLDSDGSGSISSTELGDNARKLFDQLREQLMSSRFESQPPDTQQMFDKFDTDGSGSISSDEFKAAFQNDAGIAGEPRHVGAGRLLAMLIEQYGSQDSKGVSGAALDIAA